MQMASRFSQKEIFSDNRILRAKNTIFLKCEIEILIKKLLLKMIKNAIVT